MTSPLHHDKRARCEFRVTTKPYFSRPAYVLHEVVPRLEVCGPR